MKMSHRSRLGSILFSTAFVVAFGLLASPMIKTASRAPGGIEFREATQAERSATHLRVAAGKSVIMESSVKIVRASVANPDLVRMVSIDEHELLVNAKTAGRTNVTVWQEDGKQREFALDIDNKPRESQEPATEAKLSEEGRGLTAAYRNAMARVQTAITGVDR